MKKSAIQTTIQDAIIEAQKADTVPAKEPIVIDLITSGVSVGVAMAAINKEFKAAGITKVIVQSDMAKAKEAIEADQDGMERIETFKDLRHYSEGLQEEFTVHEDEEKGVETCRKAVVKRMNDLGLTVPKKIHLGEVKSLTVDYFHESGELEVETSIKGLTQFLVDAMMPSGMEDGSEEYLALYKKLNITAGTDYNWSYLLFNRLRLDDLN